MTEPIVTGIATGQWAFSQVPVPDSKEKILAEWDEATAALDRLWPTIPMHRFREVDKAFGKWESEGTGMILYAIDNEVHHRGQGYVYLRSLGIEPPPFWERS